MSEKEFVPSNIREMAASLVGLPADVIEARLFIYLTEMWHREWADPDRAMKARRSPFFFLPCFLCGNWFTGEEISSSVVVNGSSGRSVCGNCTDDANRINERWPNGVVESVEAHEIA